MARELAIKVDPLKKELTKTLNDKMSKLRQDRDVLDKTIIDNTKRWTSVMHADEREQAKAKLSEQKRLLDNLKDERNSRHDRWKEFMRTVQRAKEREVKDLNDKLNERDGLIGYLKTLHEDQIRQSEQILLLEIADLENEKEALKKEIDQWKSCDVEQNMQMREKIKFLNLEVQKREEYISILEVRLRNTREVAAVFNDVNATNYETYRQLYRDWQEVDRQLNEICAGIQQHFQQGDGNSLVDTLKWIQTTIEGIPANCIHANDFQRMTYIIQLALRGNYTGIRRSIAFQQETNCVLQ